jgi:catechol 2,3-dioxygenase-like lactoylglutathione lyase family enzyme
MIRSLDHFVLTVADIERTCRFYERLGMRRASFAGGRVALAFGDQKINLHQAGAEFEPKAGRATPGSGDLCFLVDRPVADLAAELGAAGLTVIEGPIRRTGARRPLLSIYLRDPDGNLIELANELDA